MIRDLHDLQGKIEIPLERRGVADNDHRVGAAEGDIFRRDLLFRRTGGERIRSRQINELNGRPVDAACSRRRRDRFPRPVSGMLVQAGQRVEKRAFPNVRVPHQRKTVSFRHYVFASCGRRTSTEALSPARSAITVPQIS